MIPKLSLTNDLYREQTSLNCYCHRTANAWNYLEANREWDKYLVLKLRRLLNGCWVVLNSNRYILYDARREKRLNLLTILKTGTPPDRNNREGTQSCVEESIPLFERATCMSRHVKLARHCPISMYLWTVYTQWLLFCQVITLRECSPRPLALHRSGSSKCVKPL